MNIYQAKRYVDSVKKTTPMASYRYMDNAKVSVSYKAVLFQVVFSIAAIVGVFAAIWYLLPVVM